MYNPDYDEMVDEEDKDLAPPSDIHDLLAEVARFYCPICGEKVKKLFASLEGTIVGCDNCVVSYSPYGTPWMGRRRRSR